MGTTEIFYIVDDIAARCSPANLSNLPNTSQSNAEQGGIFQGDGIKLNIRLLGRILSNFFCATENHSHTQQQLLEFLTEPSNTAKKEQRHIELQSFLW